MNHDSTPGVYQLGPVYSWSEVRFEIEYAYSLQ